MANSLACTGWWLNSHPDNKKCRTSMCMFFLHLNKFEFHTGRLIKITSKLFLASIAIKHFFFQPTHTKIKGHPITN